MTVLEEYQLELRPGKKFEDLYNEVDKVCESFLESHPVRYPDDHALYVELKYLLLGVVVDYVRGVSPFDGPDVVERRIKNLIDKRLRIDPSLRV